MLLSLFMWLYFNWQSDRIQKNVGRAVVPLWLCALPLSAVALLLLASGRPYGLIGVFLYALTIALYAQKAIRPSFGSWGPVLRGLTVLGHFAMIVASVGRSPDIGACLIALLLAVLKAVKNLVGDVRDIQTDQHEIPARYGPRTTMWLLRGGFVMSILLFLAVVNAGVPEWPIAFLLVSWVVLEILYLRFRENEAYKWGYFGHRMLVVLTTLFLLGLLYTVGLGPFGLLLLLAALLVLHLTYGFLPGKTFPPWSSLIRGAN